MTGALAVSSVLAGILAARLPASYLLALPAALGAAALARRNHGVLAALLVLMMLAGLPFISMNQSSRQAGANTLSDAVFLTLIAVLAISALTRGARRPARGTITWLFVACAAFFCWWLFKVVAQTPGQPLLQGVSFGRDFMYFSLLLPLALLSLRERKHLLGFAVTLGVGAGIYGLGLIVQELMHSELTWLVHAEKTGTFEGLPRVYAPMNDLLIAAFPIAFAAALLGPRRWRRWCVLLALLTGLGNLFTFTRAVYVTEVLAIVLISLLWAPQSRRVRRALATLAAIALVLFLMAGSSSPTSTSSSPVAAVLSRVELAVTNVEEQSGTVQVRLRDTDRELQVLGSHWLMGLGFLTPAYHYFWGLREGSIRDDDLGSLNIIMTMGLIGLLLAYIPPVCGLLYVIKRRRGWVQYGGAVYLVAALAGSVTLGTLSSVSGLLVLGSALAFCLNWTAEIEAPDPRALAAREDGAAEQAPVVRTRAALPLGGALGEVAHA